jgi:hypothetical protein
LLSAQASMDHDLPIWWLPVVLAVIIGMHHHTQLFFYWDEGLKPCFSGWPDTWSSPSQLSA